MEKVDLHALGLSKKGVDILKLSVHALGLFGKSGNPQVGLHALGLFGKSGNPQVGLHALGLFGKSGNPQVRLHALGHWGYPRKSGNPQSGLHALGLFGKSGNTQVGFACIGAIQEVETLKLVCMHPRKSGLIELNQKAIGMPISKPNVRFRANVFWVFATVLLFFYASLHL